MTEPRPELRVVVEPLELAWLAGRFLADLETSRRRLLGAADLRGARAGDSLPVGRGRSALCCALRDCRPSGARVSFLGPQSNEHGPRDEFERVRAKLALLELSTVLELKRLLGLSPEALAEELRQRAADPGEGDE